MSNPSRSIDLLERLARLAHGEAHSAGLKPVQWQALRYLARANRFSRSPSALAAYLGATKGTVSQTLMALERKQLLSKQADGADRRSLRLELTPAATTLLRQDPMLTLSAAIDTLSAPQQAELEASLQALLQAGLQRRGGRSFGLCRTCRHFQPQHESGAPHRCALLQVSLGEADAEQICVEQEPPGTFEWIGRDPVLGVRGG